MFRCVFLTTSEADLFEYMCMCKATVWVSLFKAAVGSRDDPVVEVVWSAVEAVVRGCTEVAMESVEVPLICAPLCVAGTMDINDCRTADHGLTAPNVSGFDNVTWCWVTVSVFDTAFRTIVVRDCDCSIGDGTGVTTHVVVDVGESIYDEVWTSACLSSLVGADMIASGTGSVSRRSVMIFGVP